VSSFPKKKLSFPQPQNGIIKNKKTQNPKTKKQKPKQKNLKSKT
jgi:hypothetical protein